MTIGDLSNSFDTLLNSYSLKPEFGNVANMQDLVLDEYEKSVFLTLAQEQLLRDLIGDFTNSMRRVEEDKVLQTGLQSLIRTKFIQLTGTDVASSKSRGSIHLQAQSVSTDVNILALLLEEIYVNPEDSDGNGSFLLTSDALEVIPINFQEYSRLRSKPWGGPNRRQAWRLSGELGDSSTSTTTLNNLHLVVPSTAVSGELNNGDETSLYYMIKYVQKPKPILLIDLDDDLAIGGQKTQSKDIDLPESLHYTILERAVRLAITSRADKVQVARNIQEAEARQARQ